MSLERYLDHIEVRALTSAPAQVLEYDGVVDGQALGRAFSLLYSKFPVLRARVRRVQNGHILYVAADHKPEFTTLEGGKGELLRELGRPWDPNDTMARLTLVRNNSCGFVALRMDHSIVDGRNWTTMLNDLWRFYTQIVSGDAPRVDPGSELPCAPSDLFIRYFGKREQGGIPANRIDRSKDRKSTTQVLQGRIRLTEHDTNRLISVSREKSTSVHALVCGAILATHRAHDTRVTGSVRMACLSPIDFRDRVVPPIKATDTTSFLGLHVAEVTVSRRSDPVEIGRSVKTQIQRAINTRSLSPVDISEFKSTLERRLSIALVSNIGILPSFVLPDNLIIRDWYRIVDSPPESFAGYGVYTFDKRLSIPYFCSSATFAKYRYEDIVRDIADLLRQIN